MTPHRNVATYPVDLTAGRVLAPGEVAEIDTADAHHARLVADGALRPVGHGAQEAPASSGPRRTGRRSTRPARLTTED